MTFEPEARKVFAGASRRRNSVLPEEAFQVRMATEGTVGSASLLVMVLTELPLRISAMRRFFSSTLSETEAPSALVRVRMRVGRRAGSA